MTFAVLADSVVAHGGVQAAVLASIPSPPRGVWYVGGFPLRAYALCIIVGIVAAIWWGERRWRERGGAAGAVLDVAMFAVPFGLVGGRLYHVATDWQKYFGDGGHPMNALKIWEGGLGIWGAVLLGGVGAWIGCRVYRIPLPALGDAIAPAILLAQAIGRLGNYFNQELYGRATDLPWGLEIYLRFDSDGQLDMMNGVSTGVVEKVVQPTFLYELVWNLIGVLVLLLVDKRFRIGHGRLFALYVALYCFGRFWVELLRDDEATHIAGVRINSFTSALVFLCAIAYFLLATKGREAAEQLQPGGYRPWPWQFGALRRVGAESDSATTATTPAAAVADSPAPTETDDAPAETASEGTPGDTETAAPEERNASDEAAAKSAGTTSGTPAADASSESAQDAVSESAESTTGKSADDAVSKSAPGAVTKPAEGALGNSAESTASTGADDAAGEPAEREAGTSAEGAAGAAGDPVASEPVDSGGSESAGDTGNESASLTDNGENAADSAATDATKSSESGKN
ncbi:prolipoprotein diacylglyceryl transferase [Nocardia wallacei]|uniref:prolipoprotein diacylglyceryl transferase n=1 Tax=Nocardia wallacei TaxID=480035 RepID=UPI002453C1C8|nr:prolipoprotein diacylglyceryl transferase [Nocardia wallacei]